MQGFFRVMLRNDTMLYTTLLAKTSHKAITVLNFQSDNSKIPAISESGSDACSFSSSCIFHLCSMSYNLLFKAGHDRWAKNKQTKKNPPVNKALVIWQQQFIGSGCGGWGEGKTFYSPTIRLVFEPWECEVTSPN